jgi:hypothetical protein
MPLSERQSDTSPEPTSWDSLTHGAYLLRLCQKRNSQKLGTCLFKTL